MKQDEELIIANLGDSRAILGTMSNDAPKVVQLTTDLKPSLPSKLLALLLLLFLFSLIFSFLFDFLVARNARQKLKKKKKMIIMLEGGEKEKVVFINFQSVECSQSIWSNLLCMLSQFLCLLCMLSLRRKSLKVGNILFSNLVVMEALSIVIFLLHITEQKNTTKEEMRDCYSLIFFSHQTNRD